MAKSRPQITWIETEKRKPALGRQVLGFIPTASLMVVCRRLRHGVWQCALGGWIIHIIPTFWRDLPQPPK